MGVSTAWEASVCICTTASDPICTTNPTRVLPSCHCCLWCKYTSSCGVQWGVQKDSSGTKSNGTAADRSRISSAYFKTCYLLIENMLQHLVCLQNTVQMCENDADEGQMQIKIKPCHTSVADSLLLIFGGGSRGAGEVRSWHRAAGAGVTAAFESPSAAFKQRNLFSLRIMHSSAEHT